MSDDGQTVQIHPGGAAGADGPVVTVRGEASVEVESDLVDLHLSVRSRGADRAVVLRELEQRAAELGVLIDRFEAAIERRSTDGFAVHPEFGGSKGGKVRGYSGHLSTHLTLHDFAVLSDLVVGANAIELCEVGSPYWRLRHDHPAYREAGSPRRRHRRRDDDADGTRPVRVPAVRQGARRGRRR